MKGLTITSEIIMALGMIVLAVVFSLVSSQVIGSQQSGIFSSVQEGMAQDIADNIEQIESFSGSTQITYETPIDLYTLQMKDGKIELDIEGEETKEVRIQTAELEQNKVENADNICISRGDKVKIEAGRCETIETSDLCAGGGCNPNQCMSNFGEDCSNAGCSCGEQDSPASSVCAYNHDPNYDPEYIDGGDPVVDLSCINEDYVGVQEEGGRCNYDFECSSSLSCNPSAPSGPSGSYCCPSGLSYAGSDDGCKFVNRFHLVFVPLQYSDGEKSQFNNWVEDEYLDMWLEDLPVSRDQIKVDILDPSQVDNSQIQSTGNGDCPTADINLAKGEANNHVTSNYDHAVGIYKDTSLCGLASCGDYENMGTSKGSVSAAENPSVNWGPGVAAQEIAHNWGFNHIPPYECNDLCGGQRKYSCPNDKTSDYMQNSQGALNDYFSQEEDCIKELFKAKGWAQLPDFSKSDSSCKIHVIS